MGCILTHPHPYAMKDYLLNPHSTCMCKANRKRPLGAKIKLLLNSTLCSPRQSGKAAEPVAKTLRRSPTGSVKPRITFKTP